MMTTSSVAPSLCNNDDWQDGLSVLDANRYMLENQVDCDVTFVLLASSGDGVQGPVSIGSHRYALISRSPVFFAMLTGPLAERQHYSAPGKINSHQQQQQPQPPPAASCRCTNEIRITDIAPSTFWQLLRYLYYEKLELADDNVFAVLYAAKKYLMTSLAQQCITYLDEALTAENVCAYLENACLFEDEYPALKQRCLRVVESQSKRVFHSDSFFEISKETLCRVLKADRLSVHEIDVFRACLHWAERRASLLNLTTTHSNKRQMLGDALRLIHMPAMTIEEFTKIVIPSGLLTVDEENAVFRAMLGASKSSTECDVISQSTVDFPFPPSSRNFVSTRCEVTYGGFSRQSTFSSYTAGLPRGTTSFRTPWSITLYCDHCIKIQEIGFFGQIKANVYVAQNGYRKLDVSSASATNNFRFGDDLQLDAGLFTIGADSPFTYSGDYFTRAGAGLLSACGANNTLPSMSADHDCANALVVREATSVGFLSYLVFTPTDEIYFVDNYYSDDVLDADISTSAAATSLGDVDGR